jgi:signal transduction histidine kinase
MGRLRARLGGWDLVVLFLGATMTVLFASIRDGDIPGDVQPRAFDWLAVGLLTATVAALGLRHRAPIVMILVVLGLNAVWHGLGYTSTLIDAPTLVAYFSVGAFGDRRRQIAAVVLTAIPMVGWVVVAQGQPWSSIIDAVGWPAAAVLFGELIRSRRALMDSYQRRAERAEAEREAEARRRVTEERLRIARDLHDLLGHTVAAMMVQAEVAADKLDTAPHKSRAALNSIRDAGRQANHEIRATIELLRNYEEPELAPTPRVSDISILSANASQLGLDVRCEIAPDLGERAGLVGLILYRVVQEALTNVARHSTGRHVDIAVTDRDGIVSCLIHNDGQPASLPGHPGHGLDGMTERVSSVGGSLHFGPAACGGFEVVALLPNVERGPK